MASKSGQPSRNRSDDDGETRVQPRPKRLGFDPDPDAASPNEATGRIATQEQTGRIGQPGDIEHTARLDNDPERFNQREDTSLNILQHESTEPRDGQQPTTRVMLPHEDTVPPSAPEMPPEEDDNATRVGPMPSLDLGRFKQNTEAETRVVSSPLAAMEPSNDAETRVGPSPLSAPDSQSAHSKDAETRVAPSPLQDAETRVAYTPDLGALKYPARLADEESDKHLSQPPPPEDDSDSTRVGPLPQAMAPLDSKTQVAPPPSESFKHERRNIAQVGLPADLKLPSFDFKASNSPDVAAAKAAGVHTTLPEHLQLPTFPDLGKPPVSKPATSVPPPVPKKAAPPPLPQLSEPTPAVLDLSLPEIAPRPTQRNLTLISGSQKDGRSFGKRMMWPFVVAGVCAAIALGLFLAREQVMAVLAPKRPPPVAPPPTPQERAKSALAAGGLAYVARDYQVAIHHFEQALADDPRLVEAHRSLGIVYATLHDQAKAVRHYQDYLALSPHASDATEVLKIIEDYKHAQAKAAHEAPPPAAEPPAKHKKAGHGGSGRRHRE